MSMVVSIARLPLWLALSSCFCFVTPSLAASEQSKFFKKGDVQTLADLPASPAKERLQALPVAAQQQALQRLAEISFPATDLELLHFDVTGGVFYVDNHKPPELAATAAAGEPVVSAATTVDVLKLHSRPGASKVLYLDFDGHVISNTAWNQNSAATLYAVPFDIDGVPSSFSSTELDRIYEIWHRVAEDYAPFDVDVTTELPTSFGATVGRVLITRNVDSKGVSMPFSTSGGVSYINVFGSSSYAYYSPALVYYNNLQSDATYTAEAAAHEFGHNIGLSHDGRTSPKESYYAGQGSGYVSWAPIMGNSYYNNVTQWSQGEYSYADNTQDDMSLIQTKLAYRGDDHGNQFNGATALQVGIDGTVTNLLPGEEVQPSKVNKGVIETASDVDMFYFEAGAGTVNLTVKPAWAAFYRTSRRGANLDVDLRLYNSSGTQLAASDPTTDTYGSISVNVNAGSYFLAVKGVGNSTTPYSDYASVGQYFISGSVPVGSTIVSVAPAPSALTASAVSATQLNLSWTDNAVNESGFYVYRSTDNTTWSKIATLAANAQSYNNTGLTENTLYYYRVSAYNASGESAYTSASATTQAKLVAPLAPTGLSVTNNSKGKAVLAWTDVSNNETGFYIERASYDATTGLWSSASLIATTAAGVQSYTDSSGAGTFRYRVGANNSAGTGWTSWVPVTVSSCKGRSC